MQLIRRRIRCASSAIEGGVGGKGDGRPGSRAIGKSRIGWKEVLIMGLSELLVEGLRRGEQSRSSGCRRNDIS